MTSKKIVDVVIAQQKLSLRTDQNPEDVLRAADLVNSKLQEALPPGQPVNHQVLLLVAMNIADELLKIQAGTERFKSDIRQKSHALLTRLEKDFPVH